jgi:hypothetical protein
LRIIIRFSFQLGDEDASSTVYLSDTGEEVEDVRPAGIAFLAE